MPIQLDTSILTQGLQPLKLKSWQEQEGERLRQRALQQQIEGNQALEEERKARVAKEQRAERLATDTGTALQKGYVNGKYDRNVVFQFAPPEMHVQVGKYLDDIDELMAKSRKAKSEQDLFDAESFGRSAAEIEARGFNPGLAMLAIDAHQEQMSPAEKLLAEGLVRQPGGIQQLVAGWKAKGLEQRKLAVSEGNAARPVSRDPTHDLIDPRTGEVVNHGTPKPPPPPTLQHVETADGIRAFNPDTGELGPVIAKGKPNAPRDERTVQIMGPNGVPIWAKESDAIGKPAAQAPRAVTGQERQSLAYYNRAREAVETLTTPDETRQSLEQRIASSGIVRQGQLQRLPNMLQTDEQQRYRQAQRAFTEARLRKESGAAIPPAEYENDARTYFVQPGDSTATVEQKRKARDTVLNGLKFSAGKAFDEFYGEPASKSVTPIRRPIPGHPGQFAISADGGQTWKAE